MAVHLKISRSWLSRLLDVVRLPDDIVSAFSDRHDITVRVARDVKPLVGDPRSKKLMVEEAARIVNERNDLGVRLSGPEVAKRLARATVASSKAGEGDIEVTGRGGKALLRYSRNARGALTPKIPHKTGPPKDEKHRRASGRERGEQSVEVSGGAIAI